MHLPRREILKLVSMSAASEASFGSRPVVDTAANASRGIRARRATSGGNSGKAFVL